jgi:hypothetical protein
VKSKFMASFLLIIILIFSATFAYAEADENVVIVNPGQYSVLYSDNLLISVKVLEPKTVKVALYEEKQIKNDVATSVNVSNIDEPSDLMEIEDLTSEIVYGKDTFISTNYLSFYTKRVVDLTPGLYRVQVDTLDSSGSVLYITNTHVIIKDKSLEPAADATIFKISQPTTMQLLQNFFSSLFK